MSIMKEVEWYESLKVSAGVIIGIATWWCWEPSVVSLRAGLCAYGVLLLFVTIQADRWNDLDDGVVDSVH